MNFVGPFDIFVDQKPDAECNGDDQQPETRLPIASFQHPDGQHHGQTAREQNPCIDRAHFRVEVQRRIMKVRRVLGAVNGVEQEHAAEEQ